jgi:hypothetical protein
MGTSNRALTDSGIAAVEVRCSQPGPAKERLLRRAAAQLDSRLVAVARGVHPTDGDLVAR